VHDEFLIVVAWDRVERTDRAIGRVALQQRDEGIDLVLLGMVERMKSNVSSSSL